MRYFFPFILIIIPFLYSETSSDWIDTKSRSDREIVYDIVDNILDLSESEKIELEEIMSEERAISREQEKDYDTKKRQIGKNISNTENKLRELERELLDLEGEINIKNVMLSHVLINIKSEQKNIEYFDTEKFGSELGLRRELSSFPFQLLVLSVYEYGGDEAIKDVVEKVQRSASSFAIEKSNGIEIISTSLQSQGISLVDSVTAKINGSVKISDTKFHLFKKWGQKEIYVLTKFNVYPLDKNIDLYDGKIVYDGNVKHILILDDGDLNVIEKLSGDFYTDGINILQDISENNQNVGELYKEKSGSYYDNKLITQKNIEQSKEKLQDLLVDQARLNSELITLKRSYTKIKNDYKELFNKQKNLSYKLRMFEKSEEYTRVVQVMQFASYEKSEEEVYTEMAVQAVKQLKNEAKNYFSNREYFILNYTDQGKKEQLRTVDSKITSAKVLGFFGGQHSNLIKYEIFVAFKYRFDYADRFSAAEWYNYAVDSDDSYLKINYYTKAINLDKTFKEAYNNRGEVYMSLDMFDEAIEDFGKVLSFDVDNIFALNNRGLCYFYEGEYQNAKNDLTSAMEIAENYPYPYFNRAVVYEKTGNFIRAAKDYNNYLKINGDRDSDAENVRNKIIALGYKPRY